MDWLLIGSLWGGVTAWFFKWGLVILGLGLLIFIHELGHFLVAKACGVKCEKFYVGFDVPIKIGKFRLPSAIWKQQWGETEYGVGILPLGGYVKMLGQDDNPSKQAEEFDRARASESAAATESNKSEVNASSAASTSTTVAAPSDGSRWDPRSYLAKSVPQRMAIISAGVIMNAILAVVLASIAYGFGVEHTASVVGHVMAGGAAWQHNIPVGAEITKVDDIVDPRFEKDLKRVTYLTRKGRTVSLEYRDPQTKEIQQVTIAPEVGEDRLARLGITSSSDLKLRDKHFALPGSPAAEAGFQAGDRLLNVRIGNSGSTTELGTYADLQRVLTQNPDQTLQFTVERGGVTKENVQVNVKPMPTHDIGLSMKLGKITHIQPGSPAAEKEIKPGDEISRIAPVGSAPETNLARNPLHLPEALRRLSAHRTKVRMVVMRQGKQVTIDDIALREPRWSEEPMLTSDASGNLTNQPLSAPALGIAYEVLNEIADVVPGSPADRAGLKRGQRLEKIEFVPPRKDPESSTDDELALNAIKIPLGAEKLLWPVVFFNVLQYAPAGSGIKLSVSGQDQPVEISPAPESDWFRPERGMRLEPLTGTRIASSLSDALQLGLRETGEAMTMVIQFLQRIPDLWRHAAGPVGIFQIAGQAAEAGFAKFLLLLTVLSANLAVVNILPIPVLDGGHLVFLAYEGVRRKPPSEKIMIWLSFIGLGLILSVMIIVLTLDIGRWLGG